MSRQFVPSPHKNKRIGFSILFLLLVVIFSIPKTRELVRNLGHMIGIGSVKSIDATGSLLEPVGNVVVTKKSLIRENETLASRIEEMQAKLSDYSALLAENNELKNTLNRADKMHFVLASIIAKPGVSLYDTLIIDGGEKASIQVGKTVYANGETPIGTVETVYPNSALVRMYSSSGQNTDVRLDAISEEGKAIHLDAILIGRGGGNFTVTTPHDFSVGANVVARTKTINPKVVATFQKIISDAREPFQKLLLASPVNVNELSFVEVEQ